MVGGALLSTDTLAVIVLDGSLLIAGVNDTAREWTGGRAVPGVPLQEAFHTPDAERIRGWAADPLAAVGPSLLRRAPDGGNDGALLVWGAPAADGDGYVLIGRSAEADLEREARILRARRWEIVGQLTGGVAHDLNNRLSTVTTFSDLMLTDAEPGSQDAEDLLEIKQAGLDSASITRKLDLFSGGYVGDRTTSNWTEAVTGFEKLIRRFLGRDVELVLELDEDPPMVDAPAIRLEEILITLVANARDAMPDGGTLTVRTGRGSDPDRPCAVLEVRDTGPENAIPPLERALEPFFSSKPWGLGSGLGLTTVGGIVQDLGGSITMSREEGVETVVRVVLPRHDATSDSERDDPHAAEHDDPRHVTLIEPLDGARSALERGLGRFGIQVSAVASLSHADPETFPCDVVVSDVPDRPGAGETVVRAIRERMGEVPVVLLRRRSNPRATDPGTRGIVELAKPTDLATIRRALTDVRRGFPSGFESTAP